MTAPAATCGLDAGERRALERLERAARLPAAHRAALVVSARLSRTTATAGERGAPSSERQRSELELERWQALHRLAHRSAWRDDPALPRSRQWASARARFAGLEDRELDGWIALQEEVAANRERGISDLRPRRDGPTFLVLLEYVANRKRKAKAVLDWARAAGPAAE